MSNNEEYKSGYRDGYRDAMEDMNKQIPVNSNNNPSTPIPTVPPYDQPILSGCRVCGVGRDGKPFWQICNRSYCPNNIYYGDNVWAQ